MDLIQLQVMGALGALGGMVTLEAYDTGKNVRFNNEPEELTSQGLRWRLMEGPNDIYLSTSGYLSR